jgi:hypothetical protein
LYFRIEGVDLFDNLVLRNISHASLRRSSMFGKGSGLVSFLTVCLVPLICVALVSVLRVRNWRLLFGAGMWFLLSVAQGCLTGQYYFHYFIPAFVPLTLVLASFEVKEKLVIPILITAVGLEASQIHDNYCWRQEYEKTAAEYVPLCGAIRNRGYILTKFLAGYRICGASSLDRFAFPPFYLSQHFVTLSGSGGIEVLRQKLRRGEIGSVVMTSEQFQLFGSSFTAAGPVHVVPVSFWDE